MSEVELRKIKIKNNKNKLRKIKTKKYLIVLPLFVLVIISFVLMFTIPDIVKGDKLGVYISSESNVNQYLSRSDNIEIDKENLSKDVNNDYVAYIIFSYILNVLIFLFSVILGFHYYIKFTNEIENFERYRTLS